MRSIKGLDSVIGMTVVDWDFDLDGAGWTFTDKKSKCELDPVHGFERVRQLYQLSDQHYIGRASVPVLFDRETDTVVSNESSEIIRMLNSEFNQFCPTPEKAAIDLYPSQLRASIDAINEPVYSKINDGVYKIGMASVQATYEKHLAALFQQLDEIESILGHQRYLVGDRVTEADIRLFATLIRFDPVYYGLFKCNLRMLIEFPNIHAYMRELYQMPSIKPTVDFEHIKFHYYASLTMLNPNKIVPLGPMHDLDQPHGRDQKFSSSQKPL